MKRKYLSGVLFVCAFWVVGSARCSSDYGPPSFDDVARNRLILSDNDVRPGQTVTVIVRSELEKCRVAVGSDIRTFPINTGVITKGSDGRPLLVYQGQAEFQPQTTSVVEAQCPADEAGYRYSALIVVRDPDLYIDSFTAVPGDGVVEKTFVLSWSVRLANTCTIQPGNLDTALPTGSLTLSPAQTTAYTLVCSDGNDTVTAFALAEVVPEPAIRFFYASPPLPAAGESVSLIWSSVNTDSCRLDPQPGIVERDGSVTITADQPVTYQLTCTGNSLAVTKSLTLNPAP